MVTLSRTGRTTALTVLGTVAIVFLVTLLAGSPGSRHATPSTTSGATDTTRTTADTPPTTDARVFTLSLSSSSRLPTLGQAHFGPSGAWATSDGSTSLSHVSVFTTGSSIGELQLPSPATAAPWGIHDGTPYIITGTGVVIVDATSGAMSAPLAGEGGQVVGIAFGVERVWLLRHTATDYTLEWWDLTLTSLAKVIHLGHAAPTRLAGSVFDVYVALDGAGVEVIRSDGTITPAIAQIGHITAMAVDERFDPIVADENGHVFRIDHTTGSATGQVLHIPLQADAIAFAGDVLVIANRLSHTITQFDPSTGRPIARAVLDGVPSTVGVVGTAIWVAGQGFVTQYDSVALHP